MATVAITGGSGFIGSGIYKECRKRCDDVLLFDNTKPPYTLPKGVTWVKCDVCDKDLVHKVMDETKPDQLYLVAGVLGTSELNVQPSRACNVNINGLANFIDLAVEQKLPRTFYVTKPNVWENMYTITKECSERIIQYYMKEYGLEGVIHKWFNAYGPGQHTHPVRKAVPYFILMALNNRPMRIHGDGKQTVDLVYVDDIAKIAVEAMNKPKEELTNEEVIEVGVGQGMVVNDLAESIRDMCHSKSEIIHEPMRSGETPNTLLSADITRLKQIMGSDFKFTDYKEGMLRTINYYKNINPLQMASALEFYNGLDKSCQ